MSSSVRWQKSSHSADGNNCVELAAAPDGHTHLRESDDPTTTLTTTSPRLRSLLTLAGFNPDMS